VKPCFQNRLEERSRRIIKKLLNHQLAVAFQSFFSRIAEAQHQREVIFGLFVQA
jgi:hypothetical protein